MAYERVTYRADVDVTAECAKCRQELEFSVVMRDGMTTVCLRCDPCDTCIKAARADERANPREVEP